MEGPEQRYDLKTLAADRSWLIDLAEFKLLAFAFRRSAHA